MSGGRLFIVLGVVLAVLAGGGAFLYASSVQQQAAQNQVRRVDVVLAAKDIPAYSVISADMVKVATVDEATVSPEDVRDPSVVVGKTALASFKAEQRITRAQVAEGGFSFTIPKGKRAMALLVDPISGVAGTIKEHDFVDILFSTKFLERAQGTNQGTTGRELSSVKTLLQDIEVLKVSPVSQGQPSQPQQSQSAGEVILVLAVTDAQAELIKYARENGVIHLVLRSKDDHAVEQTGGVTQDTVVESYGLPVPRNAR
jgi:Flp pilus assembly protein CpaB